MQKTFISILVLVLVIVFFALRNSLEVVVDFWFWQVNSNLSLVIILSVTFGAVASFLLSLPSRNKKNKMIRERDERIEFLDDEILELQKKSTDTVSENKADRFIHENPLK